MNSYELFQITEMSLRKVKLKPITSLNYYRRWNNLFISFFRSIKDIILLFSWKILTNSSIQTTIRNEGENSYPRVGDEYYIGVRAMCQGTRSKMSRSFRWKRDGCKFGTEARQLRPHRIVGPGRNQRSNLPPLATLQGALDPDNSSNIVLQFAPPPKKLDRAWNSSADILPLFHRIERSLGDSSFL